jgi:hypothetical protein
MTLESKKWYSIHDWLLKCDREQLMLLDGRIKQMLEN